VTGLQRFFKYIPTFLTAFVLAIAVWISAVTSTDPTEERQFAQPIPIEVIGLDPGMMVTNDPPDQVNVVLSAPRSIWNQLTADPSVIHAVIDLSGLESGNHSVSVQVQINMRPVQTISYAPRAITVTLERLSTRTVPINLVNPGRPRGSAGTAAHPRGRANRAHDLWRQHLAAFRSGRQMEYLPQPARAPVQ
jgi:YbbR domain-containing protein